MDLDYNGTDETTVTRGQQIDQNLMIMYRQASAHKSHPMHG